MFRNRVNREIKKSKNKYYNSYFENHSNDINKAWQGIRFIINLNHCTSHKITQLNVNGKLFNNPDEIAEKGHEYFVNIGPQTEKCIPKVPK